MAIRLIRAPLPGMFYRRPSPDEAVFIEEAGTLEAGGCIGLVEVMKSFLSITDDEGGILRRFLVEDGASVDVDDPIAEIE